MEPFRVGILGATGLVGQRLVERLVGHPWFSISGLGASERSAGRTYSESCRWVLGSDAPREVSAHRVRRCRVDEFDDCDFVISALDTGVATETEPAFAEAGFAVVSNSSAFREAEGVPLVVPEVNSDHLALIESASRAARGYIVTNPNCSTTGLVVTLAPLAERFGVRKVIVATLQAISGSGLDGHRAWELVDNVIPEIRGEEGKIESEVGKILGRREGSVIRRAEIAVSAHCHRVGTLDGHLESVSIELARPAALSEVVEVLGSFKGQTGALSLPSAPSSPILIRSESDRPQPRLDRDAEGGMAVVVGRIRPCPVLGLKLVLLSHNAVRGAAGGALLNAELLAARGLLSRRVRG